MNRHERRALRAKGLAAPTASAPAKELSWAEALEASRAAEDLAAAKPRPLATLTFVIAKQVVTDLETAHGDFNTIRAESGDPPVPFGAFMVNGLLRAGLEVLAAQVEAYRTKERLVVLPSAVPSTRPGWGSLLGGSTVWR
jgi:hypothetical protein